MPTPSPKRSARPRRHPIETAAAALEGASAGLADGIEAQGLDRSLPELAGRSADIASRGSRSDRLRARLERADEKVSGFLDATKDKARAVAESARRARTVPPAAAKDLGRAAGAYLGGLGASIGYYAAAGLVGAAALVVLTVGLVQALDRLWGKPWGALAVAFVYGVVAAVMAAGAKARMLRGRTEARERVQVVRSELRHVTEPVRTAFRRRTGVAQPAQAHGAAPTASFEPARTEVPRT